MTDEQESINYCLDSIHRNDRDRYLCAQFAPRDRIWALAALYAFNLEIALIAETVREPLLGQMRLQWWRDAIDGVFGEGPVPKHPVIGVLGRAVSEFGLSRRHFGAMLDGRAFDLEEEPPEDMDALAGYAEATCVSLNRLCGEVLGVSGDTALRHAGMAWALTGLMRAVPFHARARRVYLPADLIDAQGLDLRDLFELRSTEALAKVVEGVARRALFHLEELHGAQIQDQARKAAAPVVLTAVLARKYLARLEKAGFDPFRESAQGATPRDLLHLYMKGWFGWF